MKIYKKLIGFLVLLAMILVFGPFGFTAEKTPPSLILKVASPYPKMSLLPAGTRFFIERMEQRTKGRIKFKTFWGGTLVKPPEVLDSTGKGVVDLVTGLWIYAPGKVPLGSFEYNFLFNDPRWRVQAKIKREMFDTIPDLNKELAKFNIGPALQFCPITSYDILSRVPIKTLDDLKGKRIAHTPVEYVPAFEAVGSVSVPMPAPNMYTNLERGVVDAASLPIELLYMFKLHEVAKNFTIIGFCTPCTVSLWINMDTWNRLSAKDKKLFMDVGLESEKMYIDELERQLAKAKEAFKKAGLNYYTMSDADKKTWTSTMPDLPAGWAKKMENKGMPGWAVVDKYLELSKREGWVFPRKWGKR